MSACLACEGPWVLSQHCKNNTNIFHGRCGDICLLAFERWRPDWARLYLLKQRLGIWLSRVYTPTVRSWKCIAKPKRIFI